MECGTQDWDVRGCSIGQTVFVRSGSLVQQPEGGHTRGYLDGSACPHWVLGAGCWVIQLDTYLVLCSLHTLGSALPPHSSPSLCSNILGFCRALGFAFWFKVLQSSEKDHTALGVPSWVLWHAALTLCHFFSSSPLSTCSWYLQLAYSHSPSNHRSFIRNNLLPLTCISVAWVCVLSIGNMDFPAMQGEALSF